MKNAFIDVWENFSCIAEKCSDNCCIGWEIDIDFKTYDFYKSVQGDFGRKIKDNIINEEVPSFKLVNNRCAFLNENNLCEIYKDLGKENLCQICSDHPRFYNWYSNIKETGYGMCCQEATRLLLCSSNPLKIIETEDEISDTDEFFYNEEFFQILLNARKTAFKILQNRNFSIKQRQILLLCFGKELQKPIDIEDFKATQKVVNDFSQIAFQKGILEKAVQKGQANSREKTVKDLFSFLSELEFMNEKWNKKIKDISQKPDVILSNEEELQLLHLKTDYEYENLMVYFIYRYFLQAVFSYDVISSIKLSVVASFVIKILNISKYIENKEVPFEQRVETAKDFSKEVEYSQENIETVLYEFADNNRFSFEKLIELFT